MLFKLPLPYKTTRYSIPHQSFVRGWAWFLLRVRSVSPLWYQHQVVVLNPTEIIE